MDANRFNQILIIDSIPANEFNTAKRLYEDLDTYACAYEPSPKIDYLRVESGDGLIQCIGECRKRAIAQDIIPMLQIECHGDEDGLSFADESLLYWPELKTPLTELNVATRLNLMVAVAACSGATIAKVVYMSDRAPFWGMIGPTKPLKPMDLEKAYSALYLTLLSAKSPKKAIEAFDKAAEPEMFWRTTSQGLFNKGWSTYKTRFCNEEAIESRVKRMRKFAKEKSIKPLPTLNDLKANLVAYEPVAFERFWKTFFMLDLFPEHASRFPIEYKG